MCKNVPEVDILIRKENTLLLLPIDLTHETWALRREIIYSDQNLIILSSKEFLTELKIDYIHKSNKLKSSRFEEN